MGPEATRNVEQEHGSPQLMPSCHALHPAIKSELLVTRPAYLHRRVCGARRDGACWPFIMRRFCGAGRKSRPSGELSISLTGRHFRQTKGETRGGIEINQIAGMEHRLIVRPSASLESWKYEEKRDYDQKLLSNVKVK